MSDFGDALIFAAIMTLADELRDEKRRAESIPAPKVKANLFGHYDERVVRSVTNPDRKKAADMMTRIINDADRVTGEKSGMTGESTIDMLLESVFFKCIDEMYSDMPRKIKALDKAFSCCDTEFENRAGAKVIFDDYNGSIDTYDRALATGIGLLIKGSNLAKRTQDFVSIAKTVVQVLTTVEIVLKDMDKSAGWTGRVMGNFLYNNLSQALFDELDELWNDMTPEDKMAVDPERYAREAPAAPAAAAEEATSYEPVFDLEELQMKEYDNPREAIKEKLRTCFDGKIVRKDLTKKIKEGANVPVYVLEFLLGQYCSSDDPEIIGQGVENVKRILADNFVRPDEAQKILSVLRSRGSYTVIDKITVSLNIRDDQYIAEFSNLGLKNIPISDEYPEKYDRLLCGGIWCIVQLDYEFIEEDKKNGNPIKIRKLTPIQMPHVDINELKAGRKAFTKEEWIDVMLRSIGMEPDTLTEREKWLLLARMIPLVENNFNLCELGPRSTGKSHLYKEISPNSILVSGGQTTVANLFYNMARKQVGLVGLWDCVAFDEVAGINFKDKDGIQIMKDYMASGSFARGKEEKAASASMVFVGNINQSVDVLLKTSSLFDPFPPEMGTDTAFLDRMHCYIPGWEIPKFRPEHFTNDYGFITDYLAEFMRELRKEQFGDALDKFFRLGKNLNQRDTIAVRKMVGGFIKLLYPDGEYTKEQLEEIMQISLEMRRRVKEQLKKLGGMEFYDVNFSYIDNETFEEHYVSVPEQGGGKLIPEGLCNPGQVYTIGHGKSGMIGVFRLESQMLPGSGRFERTGLGSDGKCKEAANTAFNYLKANGNRISGSISTTMKDYIINYQDLQGIGMMDKLALPTLIALCSIALSKPVLSSMAVLGEISISGTMIKVEELANSLQVCLDSGAKKVLLPITSAADLGTVPAELIGCFNLIFYSSAEDAVFKALGVE